MMDKFLIKDQLEKCSNDVIKNVENQYYDIMSHLRRNLTQQLVDIVSKNLHAPATFMPDFVTINLFDKFKNDYEEKMKEAAEYYNKATAVACDIIDKDDSENGLYRAFGAFSDISEDADVLNARNMINNIIDNYVQLLKEKLLSVFGYMQNSRQVEEDINAILGGSKALLNRVLDKALEMIESIKDDNNKTIDTVIDEIVKSISSLKYDEYIHGFGEDIFRYDGHEVSYRFEGNNLTLYMDNMKINDSYALADINRTIQEKFPQAKEVTDSMVRRISEIEMDKKEESPNAAMFIDSPLKPDVELIDTPRKKTFAELSAMLDITDDEPKEKKETPSLDIDELMSKLEINDMLDGEEYVNPNASTNPEDLRLTPEELNALLNGLDEPEEEQQVENPVDEINDENIGEYQLRMDQLMRVPEVQAFVELEDNQFVKEWKDIQAKMEAYNAKKDYEAYLESQKADVILK